MLKLKRTVRNLTTYQFTRCSIVVVVFYRYAVAAAAADRHTPATGFYEEVYIDSEPETATIRRQRFKMSFLVETEKNPKTAFSKLGTSITKDRITWLVVKVQTKTDQKFHCKGV